MITSGRQMPTTASHTVLDAGCPVCLSRDTKRVRPYLLGPNYTCDPFSHLSICTCNDCCVSFATPCPTDSALEQYYLESYRAERVHETDGESDCWDARSARARAQVAFVRRYVPTFERWLDIGAGRGDLLDEVRRQGAVTAAIEPDTKCARRIRGSGHHVYSSLAESPSDWDTISFSHVLEHLGRPRRFLEEARAALAQDGHVFCEVPNETRLSQARTDIPHLLFFTGSSLVRLLQECGFTVVGVSSCGDEPSVPRWRRIVRTGVRWAARRVDMHPSQWIDRVVYPHFSYHESLSRGAWLRIVARKTR